MQYLRLLLTINLIIVLAGCAKKTEYPPEIIKLQESVQKRPEDQFIYKDLIKLLYEKEFCNDSLKYSVKFIEIVPKDIYGYLYAGMSCEKVKEWDNAEKYYKEICEKFPETGEGPYKLALLKYKMGEYKDSANYLEKVMVMDVQDTKLYIEMMNLLAEAYCYNDNIEGARKLLDKALELDPFNKDILYNYGLWLLREGKYAESIQFLEKLAAQHPQEEFVYMRLGKAYYHSHERGKAEKAFWDAAKYDPTVKPLAEIVHVQDMYSTYNEINTAMIKVIEKYDYKYGDKYYIRGIIENMGLEMAQWVTVVVRVYDKEENLIEQKVFECSPKNIRPEQYVFFKIEIPYRKDIAFVRIEPNWHKRATSVYLK